MQILDKTQLTSTSILPVKYFRCVNMIAPASRLLAIFESTLSILCVAVALVYESPTLHNSKNCETFFVVEGY